MYHVILWVLQLCAIWRIWPISLCIFSFKKFVSHIDIEKFLIDLSSVRCEGELFASH